jgi:predicted GNAT family N-acyltransferase
MPLYFEQLAKHHDKISFNCGVKELDDYLKQRASQDIKRRMNSVYVLAKEKEIIGFYTLSAFTVHFTDLPSEFAKKYPQNMLLPCWLIGRLAVDIKHHNQKFGETILMHALRKAKNLSEQGGGCLVILDAKNEGVKSFYLKYGFKPIINDELRLYLPTACIAD